MASNMNASASLSQTGVARSRVKAAALLASLVAVISAALPVPAGADDLKPQLRISVFGRSPIVDATQKDEVHDTALFTDETVRIQVDMAWRDSSLVPDAALAEWWRDVRVHLTKVGGSVQTIAADDMRVAEVRTKGHRVIGTPQALKIRPLPDATFAIYEIDPLPAGEYRLTASSRFVARREYQVKAYEVAFVVIARRRG